MTSDFERRSSQDDLPERNRENVSEYQAVSSTESLWEHNAGDSVDAQAGIQSGLEGEIDTGVAIVGAGITGMTAALRLQQSGMNVCVVEAHRVGHGVTGFNSGHLTSMLLDMEFRTVINHFGEEATRTVTLAIQNAIDQIERNCRDYRIDCDFKRIPGYLFAERERQIRALQEEARAAEQAGLQISYPHHAPLPFPVADAISVAGQARFNPLKYVQGLAREFINQGGRIYERTPVIRVNNNDPPFQLETPKGWVNAQDVILATHTPIGFKPSLQSRLEPLRSYIIGIRIEGGMEDALYWDMEDPYHYLRLAEDERGPLVIIGGEDHKTGSGNERDAFARLEAYAHQRFNVKSVDYRWSAQLYNPVDGLPYIGFQGNTFIGTGYSGEGLTFGTLAGNMLADMILDIPNACTDILTPNRAKPVASAGGFISENVHVVKHYFKDRYGKAETEVDDLAEIPRGEGRIIKQDGQKVAAYRDLNGKIRMLSPVCTHMGCIVNWNGAEKSWDCPCHGGRYDALGNVLNGPPTEGLEPLEDG